MFYSKVALAVMAAGVMMTSTQAKAEEWSHRDLRHDYARASALRNDIAADRYRLNEDLRRGRFEAAARERRDIARDQAELNAQYRDIRHDRR